MIQLDRTVLQSMIKEKIEKGGYICKVSGFSMLPTIFPGSLVLIKKLETIEKNAIYLFCFHNTLIIHRLIDTQDNQYTFQGDAHESVEIIHNSEQILGKVENVRGWKLFSYNPNSPSALYLYLFYRKIVRKFFLRLKGFLIPIVRYLSSE